MVPQRRHHIGNIQGGALDLIRIFLYIPINMLMRTQNHVLPIFLNSR